MLKVGPGQRFATPCAAFAVARDGDRVTIDGAGSKDYRGDVCTITADRLVIKGVNGRPHIRAAGQNAQGKAIWVVTGDDTTIVNVRMSGARVPDRNGAAIRQEGTDLTLKRVHFHGNEMGLLAGDDPDSDIRIRRSRFADNGFGDGYSHNIYVNHVRSLTDGLQLLDPVPRRAPGEVPGGQHPALYNRFRAAVATAATRSTCPTADWPPGRQRDRAGPDAARTEPDRLRRGGRRRRDSRLYVVGNTLVDDSDAGGTAVLLGETSPDRVEVRNNVVVDFAVLDRPRPGVAAANCVTTRPSFVDRSTGDLLAATWLAVPARDDVAARLGRRLLAGPEVPLRHPAGRTRRTDAGRVVGAFGTPVPG